MKSRATFTRFRRDVSSTIVRAALLAAVWLGGCASVEPWQKGDLAAPPMLVEDDACHRFERNVEVYREGAVGANGGKSGGGCGCS